MRKGKLGEKRNVFTIHGNPICLHLVGGVWQIPQSIQIDLVCQFVDHFFLFCCMSSPNNESNIPQTPLIDHVFHIPYTPDRPPLKKKRKTSSAPPIYGPHFYSEICMNRECDKPSGYPQKPNSIYCSARCQSRGRQLIFPFKILLKNVTEQNIRQGRVKSSLNAAKESHLPATSTVPSNDSPDIIEPEVVPETANTSKEKLSFDYLLS